MSRATCGLLLTAVIALPAAAAEPVADAPAVVTVAPPRFPTPMQTSILGLSLTAVAVIGARVSNRNSDTMMYMVLATVAVTALMVVFSDKQYRTYQQARQHVLRQLRGEPTGGSTETGDETRRSIDSHLQAP
jgi:hypothetical protein